MLLVVVPVGVVGVSVCEEKFTMTKCLVILPFSFVACAIWPNNFPESMPHASLPLALVDGSSLVAVLVLPVGGI